MTNSELDFNAFVQDINYIFELKEAMCLKWHYELNWWITSVQTLLWAAFQFTSAILPSKEHPNGYYRYFFPYWHFKPIFLKRQQTVHGYFAFNIFCFGFAQKEREADARAPRAGAFQRLLIKASLYCTCADRMPLCWRTRERHCMNQRSLSSMRYLMLQAVCALRSLSIMGGIQNLIICLKMAWSEHHDCGVNIR